MPTYQYACTECGERTEAVQSFTDAALTECLTCGGRLRKVYSAVGVVFKGSGFYKNDSRAGNGDGSPREKAGSADKGGSETGTSSDSTSSDKGSADKGSADKGSADRGSADRGSADRGSADRGKGGTDKGSGSSGSCDKAASNGGGSSGTTAPATSGGGGKPTVKSA